MNNRFITISHNNNKYEISIMSRDSGEELIFFIHGLGCSKNYFDTVYCVNELTKYSIVAVDLPGFGGSTIRGDFSCDLKEHAEICSEVLALYPHHTIHLVGHSMGGAIGVLLADMIQDRLGSFINIEGNLIGEDCTTSRRKSSVSFEEFASKQLPALILTTSLSDEPGRRMWSRTIRMSDKNSLYLSSHSLVTWSDSGLLLKKFKELQCSKIYIYGEKNSFMRILSLLDMIPAVSISRSGHFPMIDNPAEFYHVLSCFLNGTIFIKT